MNFARRRHGPAEAEEWGELPLTSMIDVVFLLLIFFLVTSQLGAPERELPATLRTIGRSDAVSELQPQIVRVRRVAGGGVAGGGVGVVYEIGSHAVGSGAELRAVLEGLPREQGLIVRGDDDVPVEAVAAALQAGVDAGFARRSYVPGS